MRLRLKKNQLIKFLGICFSLYFFITIVLSIVQAQNCDETQCEAADDQITCIKNKKTCWENKINDAQKDQISLSNTISILNGQVSLQQLQIQQTLVEILNLEKEIIQLSQKIGSLNTSLDNLTAVMVKRVSEQYKRAKINPYLTIFSNHSLNALLIEYKYLKLARQQTIDAMQRAESQRLAYDEQKNLKEKKQDQVVQKKIELEKQRVHLEQQRSEQQYLLTTTKNNEVEYQNELAKTLQELQAIQSIIAGQGTESEVGGVIQGDVIASIIPTASPCSTGGHLHFEVVQDEAHYDPANYLKIADFVWDNQPDPSFSFSGNWEWPMFDPARITQGYGYTYYARVVRAYGGSPHTGIDMISKSKADYRVRAVKNGILYRGSVPCGGGLLRYVKIKHKDENISTYYLHINY